MPRLQVIDASPRPDTRKNAMAQGLAQGVAGMGSAIGNGLMAYGNYKETENLRNEKMQQLVKEDAKRLTMAATAMPQQQRGPFLESMYKVTGPEVKQLIDHESLMSIPDLNTNNGKLSDVDKSRLKELHEDMVDKQLILNELKEGYTGDDPTEVTKGNRPWVFNGEYDQANKIIAAQKDYDAAYKAWDDFLKAREGNTSPAPQSQQSPVEQISNIFQTMGQPAPDQGPMGPPAPQGQPAPAQGQPQGQSAPSQPQMPKELQTLPPSIQQKAMETAERRIQAGEDAALVWQEIIAFIQQQMGKQALGQ